MKTGPAPGESPVSVLSDNNYVMGTSDLELWTPELIHPYFMDLVHMGEFVLAYIAPKSNMRVTPLDTAV